MRGEEREYTIAKIDMDRLREKSRRGAGALGIWRFDQCRRFEPRRRRSAVRTFERAAIDSIDGGQVIAVEISILLRASLTSESM